MAYADPDVRRRKDRERVARRTAERRLAGLCTRCGRTAPAPDRALCEKCAEKKNRSARARDARLRAAGKPRRDPAKARAAKRRNSRRKAQQWSECGLCNRCGKLPAVPERTRAPSADTRFRRRRSEVYTRTSVPWGNAATSSTMRSSAASGPRRKTQSTPRGFSGFAFLPSADKPSKTIIHLPRQFRASGSSSLMRRRAAAERSRHQPSGRDPITLLPSTNTRLSIPPSMDRLPFLGDRCIRCLYEPAIRRSRKRVVEAADHRGCGAAIMNTVSLLPMRPGAGHSWIDENSPFREGMRSRASAPLLFGAHLSSLRIVRRTLVGAPE